MPDLTEFDDVPLTQVESGARHDATGVSSSPYLHGGGGLLNMPGADTRVISAIISPVQGIATELPVINGEFGTTTNSFGGVDEEASIAITGVTEGALDNFDNQPTGECVLGPEGGLLKAGAYVNPYGRFRGSTREVSIYRAGRLASLCEPITLQLMNRPGGFGGIAESTLEPSLDNAIMNELASRIFESLHSFQRMFSRRVWIGNPANNSGEKRDIWGFDQQINTGTHRDRTTSAVMTALDSDVKDFNFDFVGGTGRDIVEYIEEVDHYLHWNAEQMGLDPFDYWLVMRPELFRQITAVWPIRENFAALRQIAQYSNARVNFDGSAVTRSRDDLRRRRVLPINGREVTVILDGSIPESSVTTTGRLTGGEYASGIYFIPRTVRGNIPATFWKYFNHANGQARAIEKFAGPYTTFTSDGGVFRWYVQFTNGCIKLGYEISPKLVLLAPQLAGRIQNVGYIPLQHTREPYPDSAYFFNGGNTNSTPQRFYVGWSATQQQLS